MNATKAYRESGDSVGGIGFNGAGNDGDRGNGWVRRTAQRLGLSSTRRPRGRPRLKPESTQKPARSVMNTPLRLPTPFRTDPFPHAHIADAE